MARGSPPRGAPVPAPVPIIPAKPKAQALYDYDAADETEISFTAGEILTLLETEEDPDWPIAQNTKGEQGMVRYRVYSANISLILSPCNIRRYPSIL